jgi:hypothetical protein
MYCKNRISETRYIFPFARLAVNFFSRVLRKSRENLVLKESLAFCKNKGFSCQPFTLVSRQRPYSQT